eukprot:PhF_6_TR13312/c0_g1_i1/m.21091
MEWLLAGPSTSNSPPTRGRHTTVLDRKSRSLVTFGGQNFDLRVKYNSISKFNIDKREWRETSGECESHGDKPTPRSSHSSVEYNGGLYVFGGTTSLGLPHQCMKDNGVWRYDFENNVWSSVVLENIAACKDRYGHTTVHLGGGKVALFGGMTDAGPEAFTYILDLEAKTCSKLDTAVSVPLSGQKPFELFFAELFVYGHTAAYHPPTKSMYIFGGTGKAAIYSQLFARLDLSSKVWSEVQSTNQPPEGRYVHSSAIDECDNMYVFGGFSGIYRNDLHAFNVYASTWREIHFGQEIPRPAPRSGSTLVFDFQTDSLYLFGGCDDETYFNDVWQVKTQSAKSLRELAGWWIASNVVDKTIEMNSLRRQVTQGLYKDVETAVRMLLSFGDRA